PGRSAPHRSHELLLVGMVRENDHLHRRRPRNDLRHGPNPTLALQADKTHIGSVLHSRSDRGLRTLSFTTTRVTLECETKPGPHQPPLSSDQPPRRRCNRRRAHRIPRGVTARSSKARSTTTEPAAPAAHHGSREKARDMTSRALPDSRLTRWDG